MKLRMITSFLILFSLLSVGVRLHAATPRQRPSIVIANHIPPFVRTAPDLGHEDPDAPMNLRVWLNFRNPAKLHDLAQTVLDAHSRRNSHWLGREGFRREFEPTLLELNRVSAYLASRGLNPKLSDDGLSVLANQLAGTSLGLAAPIVYQLPPEAITDILPAAPSVNVTGQTSSGGVTTTLSEYTLAGPETSAPFYSALYNVPSGSTEGLPPGYYWEVITFGTDSSLAAAPGWDPVTGVGVPNGAKFVRDAAGW